MKLYIKNMVCDRCISAVQSAFEKIGFPTNTVKLGKVDLDSMPDQLQLLQLDDNLKALGFERLTDRKKQIVAQVKALIIELIHYDKEGLNINLSAYLADQLATSYTTLSTIFSENEGQTIEQFVIGQKIERVKELLSYGEKSLSEIAYSLNYSSVAHLSAQFKKTTGLTASEFRQQLQSRKTLDHI